MPQKTWAVGEEVLAADFQTYAQNQVVPQFTSAAQRDAQWAAPPVGAMCVTADTGRLWQYIGGGWYLPFGVLAVVTGTANVAGASPSTATIITTAALTIPANRRIQITYNGMGQINGSTGPLAFIELMRGASLLNSYQAYCSVAGGAFPYSFTYIDAPPVGPHTYSLRLGSTVANVGFDAATATLKRVLTVTDIGSA